MPWRLRMLQAGIGLSEVLLMIFQLTILGSNCGLVLPEIILKSYHGEPKRHSHAIKIADLMALWRLA